MSLTDLERKRTPNRYIGGFEFRRRPNGTWAVNAVKRGCPTIMAVTNTGHSTWEIEVYGKLVGYQPSMFLAMLEAVRVESAERGKAMAEGRA